VGMSNDGQIVYEDVYAFCHKDAIALTEFFEITLQPARLDTSDISVKSRVLELSASDFAPIVVAGRNCYFRGHLHLFQGLQLVANWICRQSMS
jgi:hypothetical protein